MSEDFYSKLGREPEEDVLMRALKKSMFESYTLYFLAAQM